MGTANLQGGGVIQGTGYKSAGTVLVVGKQLFDNFQRWAYQGNPGWTNKIGTGITPIHAWVDQPVGGIRSDAADGFGTMERSDNANPYRHISRAVNLIDMGQTAYYASPAVRMQPDGQCYFVQYKYNLVKFCRAHAGGLGIDYFGDHTVINYKNWLPVAVGDLFELEAVGNHIIFRNNGVEVFDWIDNTLQGGKAGVFISDWHFSPISLCQSYIYWDESMAISGNGSIKGFGRKFKHRRDINAS